MSKYIDRAKALRAIEVPHYNCAQAVVVPFAQDAGLSEETATAICSNFGSGMKRGSACGAIAGGLMVLGMYGIEDPVVIGAYYKKLRDNHEGMLDCAPLLKRNKELGLPKRPHCDGLIYECIGLVEEILKEQGKLQG